MQQDFVNSLVVSQTVDQEALKLVVGRGRFAEPVTMSNRLIDLAAIKMVLKKQFYLNEDEIENGPMPERSF